MSDKTVNPTDGARWLQIGEMKIRLRPEDVPTLYEANIVYDCGDEHDLHIDPDGESWSLGGFELLCLAIARAASEPDMYWCIDCDEEAPHENVQAWVDACADSLEPDAGPQVLTFTTAREIGYRWGVVVPVIDGDGVKYRATVFATGSEAAAALAEAQKQGELDLSSQAGALE